MAEDDRDRVGERAPERPRSRGVRAGERAASGRRGGPGRRGADPAPQGSEARDASAAARRRIATLAAAATVGAALAAFGMAAVQAVKIARARGPRKVIRLLPFGIGWQVKIDGAERASSLHEHRTEAVAAARDLAHRTAPAELVLHDRDGRPEGKVLYRAGRWAEWI